MTYCTINAGPYTFSFVVVYYVVLTIGSFALPSRYVLSPMAGVSDLAFRLTCRGFAPFLAYTEMISARALMFGNRKTLRLLSTNEADRPLGVQILAGDEEVLRSAVHTLGGRRFDILELNAACPVPKVVKKGEGAGLLKEPRRLHSLLRILVEVSPVPVTVKTRTGWDDRSVNAVEIARLAEDAGVNGIFIHGRTREQAYGGQVSYRTIKEVKQAVRIPVIGSGNIFSARLASMMFSETGCDGVAVARGALGNPWIFRSLLGSQSPEENDHVPGVDDVVLVMRRHLDYSMQEHGEKKGVVNFRKFFIWYSKGFSNVAPLRKAALAAKTGEEMGHMIDVLKSERRNMSIH